MMSYVVKIVNDKRVIHESETGVNIPIPVMTSDVNVICRKLNLGSGFEGFTPGFFTYEYKGNLNEHT